MKRLVTIAAACLLGACTQLGANPKAVPPDLSFEFSGDYRKMAECLYEEHQDARLTWFPISESAEVATFRFTGDYMMSWIITKTGENTFRADFRVLGFRGGARSVIAETCAARSA
jgi:hypothetical protein